MPEFLPGELKTAQAGVTVRPSGLACSAELFLGPNDQTKITTSGPVSFISTGAEQLVNLPVTMPTEGNYHVYLDVYAEDILVAAYQAIEDVIVEVPSIAFTYSQQSCSYRVFEAAYSWMQATYSVMVTNPSSVAVTRLLTWYYRSQWMVAGDGDAGTMEHSFSLTLQPGQSITITGDSMFPRGTYSPEYSGIPQAMGYPVCAWMRIADDAGGGTEECQTCTPPK